MECPKCGGPMWDNRQTKKSPKQPDYKCKDRQNCDGVIWPPKGQSGANGGNGAARQVGGNGASASPRRPLVPLYLECLKDGAGAVRHVLGKDAPVEAVMNAAATLFIAASRDGSPLRVAPKPKPAPPPPPPEPEPVDDWQDGDMAEHDLPF